MKNNNQLNKATFSNIRILQLFRKLPQSKYIYVDPIKQSKILIFGALSTIFAKKYPNILILNKSRHMTSEVL